jgi:prepilin-type N-terminal cleavage/methylation domain-containing protein
MRREEGFTLIELLIVLVIAGLLLGGVYTMMIRQQQSYQTQDLVVEAQQNLRSSFILLRYDLRMIGHGLTEGTAPISATFNNQVTANGTDGLTFPASGASTVVIENGGITKYTLIAGAPITIPVASVEGFPAATPYLVNIIDLGTGILLATADVTAVGQASPPTPPTLTLVPCPSVACPPTEMPAGRYIGLTPQFTTFGVSNTITADCQHPPCLQRIAGGVSVLAEGVEDFQLAYGFDGINGKPADGKITDIGAAANDDEWVFNAAGDTWPADTSGLRAIRVSLLLRTTNRDPAYKGDMTGVIEDHTWTSSVDGYRRRVVQFMEIIRNLSL